MDSEARECIIIYTLVLGGSVQLVVYRVVGKIRSHSSSYRVTWLSSFAQLRSIILGASFEFTDLLSFSRFSIPPKSIHALCL
jgi:hypothetical protein